MSLPYRDFLYPLNVFMHILAREEGGVSYLHYGFFERDDESIAAAQERSTRMLLDRLPAPPARILDVGSGLGTTLARLTTLGYDAHGINPDAQQVAIIRERHGDAVRIDCIRFEDLPASPFDTVIFQESSQYIDSEALFAKAAGLTRHVVVIDEFSLQPLDTPGALHSLAGFIAAAGRHGFEKSEEIDVSQKVTPSTRYFMERFETYRERLIADLGVTSQQVDELIEGGVKYLDLYARGVYGYRVMQFRAR
jgi:SAM-dependent methyltransferase